MPFFHRYLRERKKHRYFLSFITSTGAGMLFARYITEIEDAIHECVSLNMRIITMIIIRLIQFTLLWMSQEYAISMEEIKFERSNLLCFCFRSLVFSSSPLHIHSTSRFPLVSTLHQTLSLSITLSRNWFSLISNGCWCLCAFIVPIYLPGNVSSAFILLQFLCQTHFKWKSQLLCALLLLSFVFLFSVFLFHFLFVIFFIDIFLFLLLSRFCCCCKNPMHCLNFCSHNYDSATLSAIQFILPTNRLKYCSRRRPSNGSFFPHSFHFSHSFSSIRPLCALSLSSWYRIGIKQCVKWLWDMFFFVVVEIYGLCILYMVLRFNL